MIGVAVGTVVGIAVGAGLLFPPQAPQLLCGTGEFEFTTVRTGIQALVP